MGVFGIIAFILGALLTIFGLILLIFNKTRALGKKISLIFIIICLVGFFLAKTYGDSYPNEEPGTITKSQYKQLKEGMTKDEIVDIIGEPSSKNDDIRQWNYIGIDGVEENAEVTFSFDLDDQLDLKLDGGLTHQIDSTVSSSNEPLETTNEDYIYDVEFAIEDALGETVDWNDKSKEVVKEIEINDNLGKNDGSKLILVHLNAPVKATNNFIKKTVNDQTLEIAKSIKDDSSIDFTVDSITYFWYLPLTDSNGKTKSSKAYKISLEKDTLENINYEDLDSVDLPAIADQYNVLFKE